MSPTEKFYRKIHAEALAAGKKLVAGQALTGNDMMALGRAVRLVEDAANTIAERDKHERARRSRIQWIYAGNHTYVAKVGRKTYRVVFSGGYGSLSMFDGLVSAYIGKTGTSIESASRKIRAWRKK